MAKITGIGGVFFKSKGDSATLAAWHQKQWGMSLADFSDAIGSWTQKEIRWSCGSR